MHPSQFLARDAVSRQFAYRLLAAAIHRRIREGKLCTVWLARTMIALAPCAVCRRVARELRAALAAGSAGRALAIAHTARSAPDRRAEKIVSHRYRYVWICNPKVASRSLITALCAVDPDAELVRNGTTAQLYEARPRIRNYLSFAFVRNPYTRTHSFYADKLLRAQAKVLGRVEGFHGISRGIGFDDLCAWLNSPYGADAFADRHWLSQHLQIRLPAGRMPDVVGRYERLEEDLSAIARRLDMPVPNLPRLNTMTEWRPVEARDHHRQQRERDLSVRNRRMLRARYAEDFELLDYPP